MRSRKAGTQIGAGVELGTEKDDGQEQRQERDSGCMVVHVLTTTELRE